jgi:hypothetical protein
LFIRTVLCHVHPELQITGPADPQTAPAYHLYAAQNIEGERLGGPLVLSRYRASRSARVPAANETTRLVAAFRRPAREARDVEGGSRKKPR